MISETECKKYVLTVPGEPVAKGRPRVGKFGTYTPKKTLNYETYVKELWVTSYGQTMLEGELKAEITAYFSIPKSTSKKKKVEMSEGRINPIKRPDADNIAKTVLDALNGIAYYDDSQIVEVTVKKRYAENPRMELAISI